MNFEIPNQFSASAAEVFTAYASEELYEDLVGLPKLGGIEVLERSQSANSLFMSIRFRFNGHLPAAVTAVVDASRISWVQNSTADLSTLITTYEQIPDHYPDRLRASGTVTVTDTPHGSIRTVSGTVKVRAPLLAGRVESAIVSGLEEYLDSEREAVNRYIAQNHK